MAQNILEDVGYQKSAADTLKRCLDAGLVDAKDKHFVTSLLNQYATKGILSVKQWPWVEKMMIRAMGVDVSPEGNNKASIEAELLFELFATVKEKIKSPSLLFLMGRGESSKPIKIYPKKSFLNIVLANTYPGYLATLYSDGQLSFGKYVDDDTQKKLTALMMSICENPTKALAEHGKLMNKCCFCKTTLSDPKSVNHGYGPVCAKNWGMAW